MKIFVPYQLIVFMLSAFILIACGRIGFELVGDREGSPDGGLGSDAVSEEVIDSDIKTGTDSNWEKDADLDTDTYFDTDTDWDADTYLGTDAIFDTDANSDTATVLDCADGNGRLDTSTHLCWQHPIMKSPLSWAQAMDYCEGLSLGGENDWQLATDQEFMDILGGCQEDSDIWQCHTCATSEKCTALFGPDSHWYWSSSSDIDDESYAWYVNSSTGRVGTDIKTFRGNARCVLLLP